ncbi:hypothetical protein BO221_20285 [Archangium sp. Cb G35]|uniref:DUF3332 family protein n=1 Tax=Archangium sp. Cb G35 TaxID=1920190 RepID=UPI000935EBE8|nr:DUF3332 family protein [Archangium sp. Cb G35]OJT23208.1 hypothetical protein BO221_20285 [Archangium sp. Cb G35]
MKSRSSRLVAVLFASVLSLHVSGCFGSFALTRNIYALNERISDNVHAAGARAGVPGPLSP